MLVPTTSVSTRAPADGYTDEGRHEYSDPAESDPHPCYQAFVVMFGSMCPSSIPPALAMRESAYGYGRSGALTAQPSPKCPVQGRNLRVRMFPTCPASTAVLEDNRTVGGDRDHHQYAHQRTDWIAVAPDNPNVR